MLFRDYASDADWWFKFVNAFQHAMAVASPNNNAPADAFSIRKAEALFYCRYVIGFKSFFSWGQRIRFRNQRVSLQHRKQLLEAQQQQRRAVTLPLLRQRLQNLQQEQMQAVNDGGLHGAATVFSAK
jgi:hypothetical protein